MEYRTRSEKNGMALQVSTVSSRSYVRILHIATGRMVAQFNSGPYVGPLKALYAAFQDRAECALPADAAEFSDLSPNQRLCYSRVSEIISKGWFDSEYRLAA